MKVGIIGSKGNVGSKRSDILVKSFSGIKQCLYDITDTKWFSNPVDFLKSTELDAVFICVPHTLTKALVIDALDMGMHVFAEKPPGICLNDVNEMHDAYVRNKKKNNKLKLKFGFNHRYYHHIQLAKKTIESGQLGRILWMRGLYGKVDFENWRADKELAGHGILISQGIHMVDLFRYLSGEEFENPKCLVSHFKKEWFEDDVMALMKSKETGISSFLHSSCLMGQNTFNLMIGMENGYIKINGLFTRTKSFGFPEEVRIAHNDLCHFYGNPVEVVTTFGDDLSWTLEMKEFFDAIEKDQPIVHGTLNDATEVMALIDKIYEADK